MARRGFVFAGFPIANDVYISYSFVIGGILVGVLGFVLWENRKKNHEKVD